MTGEIVEIKVDREGAAALYTALSVMGPTCLTQKLWIDLDDVLTDEEKESFCIVGNPINSDPEVQRS